MSATATHHGAGPTMAPIAVIGMAGRFPQAADTNEFWQNLLDGRDCLTEFTDEDLLARGERAEYLAHPDYVRRRPSLAGADTFDARAFGMTPREAEIHDPQQRVLLEVAHSALEHAGYDPARYPGAIGVFAGTNVNRYRFDHLEQSPNIAKAIAVLTLDVANSADYVATMIAHRVGLRGPSMTVLTACSTTMTAVHSACLSLLAGDCDMALAGAATVEIPLDYGYFHVAGGILARDGRPRPFDAAADGTNFGSGAGAVVLKRLDRALADRDTVIAVIRGTALNNDGRRKSGFTAPSMEGQAECVATAIRRSGLDAGDISYVEAHGTGTAVGDPIEIAGLAAGFSQAAAANLPAGTCWIGSVKASVGHLGPVSGACGIIKTALALQHEVIPATIHVSRINPLLRLDETPFRVATVPVPWPREPGRPRRAGVSSFGIGGTNGHLVIEEAPTPAPRATVNRDAELIVWSGAEPAAEEALRSRLADHFDGCTGDGFRDTAYTLRVGRAQRQHRGAVVARDPAEAAHLLRSGEGLIRSDGVRREAVFCFSGQGSQYPGMAHRLYAQEPDFRDHCDEAFALLRPLVDRDLAELWRGCADPAVLAETVVAQPLLFVIEHALARTLADWGVVPARVLGHSLGELVAATHAGVFSLADGLRAVVARAEAMQHMPRGAMLAVSTGVDQVRAHLTDGIALAAVNADQQCVISGPADALATVADKLRAGGLHATTLNTSHAFHSPAMAPAAERFEAVLTGLDLNPPALPLISCATGEPVTTEQAVTPSFWARQLVEPVYFATAARALFAPGPAFALEIGPGRTLTSLLRRHPEVRASGSVPLPTLLGPDERDAGALDHALGRLWVAGLHVDLLRRDARGTARRVPVPGYPYQRRRFWVDAPPGYQPLRDVPVALAGHRTDNPDTATEALPTGAAGPPDPPAPDDWSIGIPDWVRRHDGRPRGPDRPTGAATAVLALPARADLAATVRTAFQRAGYGTVLATVRRDGDPERPIGTLLDASSDADWDALLHRAERSGRPSVVAYAALLDAPDTVELSTVDAQLARGYYGVLACARAIARAQRRGSGAVTLIVLTRHSVDVTGGEPVNPATAMVHGLVRTIELEHPTIRCVVLDVGAETATEPLTAAVADPTDPLLALRGTATWAPVLRQVPRPGHGGPPSLRTGGVYLITGGLGGIGLVVAKALADSGLGPRIALLGRSAVPDPGAPRRARGKGRAARVSGGEVAAALAELTDAGAEVLVVTADVADPTAMRAALRTIEERFGPVNGVVHAAGVPGGGLLDRRNREDTEAVFAAKIDGTLVLDECFAGRPPLDFLLLCSSQASLTGLVGSADYAAANGFLNAYAQQRGRGAGATTAVAWPGWSEVGMMAAAGADLDAVIGTAPAPVALDQAGTDAHPAEPESVEYLVRYDQRQDWELDEHRFDGVPLLAGTSALALTLTAVRTLGLFPPDTPLDLRDAVFLSPINGAEPIEVGVVLTPMGDTFRFRVQSRPAGSDGSWKYHVNGVVAGSAEPARRVNPDAPRTAMTALPDTDAGTLTGRLQYGPRWHTLTGLWHGAGEFVAELTLPEPFHADLASHPVHPALVDRASIAILIAGYRPTGQYLPFLYRRFTSFGPLPSKVLVFGRPGRERPGVLVIDADICDPKTGAVLLELRSYTVRETQPDQFTHRLAATAEPARREPAAPGVAAANGSRPVDDSPTAGGLPLLNPRDGAAAFREVLDGGYPPLVLVQAPGPRVEVRGMPWTDRATPPPSQPSPPVVEAPVLAGAAESAGSGVDMVDTLRELWSEALGVDEIALDDDFFDLGGNSLVSVQLSARIRQRFGVDLSAAALFDATTIRLLADELTALGAR